MMVARVIALYPQLSATIDEGYHIAAGLEAYQQGEFKTGIEQPPLARWAIALLPHWAGVKMPRPK